MNIAHLHPAIVHMPIGIWYISAILYFASVKKLIPTPTITFIGMVSAGIGFTILSIITGVLQIIQLELALTDILGHVLGAIFSLTFASLIVLTHLKSNKTSRLSFLYVFLVICVSITGHYGGTITHGKNYLFNFPGNDLQQNTIGNTHYVEIFGMKYLPSELTIARGDSVIFLNKDLVPHDVVNDLDNVHLSPKISTKEVWGTSFYENTNYHCSFHPSMKGAIIIE